MTSISNLVRNMENNPPTRIRVYYADSKIGLNCVASLCQLGYTVILDKYYKTHHILKTFYNVEFDDPTGSKFHDFVFDISPEDDKLITSKKFSPGLFEYIKANDVSMDNFVAFCIYHWGLSRGNRAIWFSPVYVDKEKINKWDLKRLI